MDRLMDNRVLMRVMVRMRMMMHLLRALHPCAAAPRCTIPRTGYRTGSRVTFTIIIPTTTEYK